jgi:glycopeptide antibiotics resistance protein
MASIGRISPGFRSTFDSVFGPNWTHIAMHTFLFAVLALLLCWLAKSVSPLKSLLFALGLALLIGLLQEALQAFTSGSYSIYGSIFDLWVDLSGAVIGWSIGRLLYGLLWTKPRAY